MTALGRNINARSIQNNVGQLAIQFKRDTLHVGHTGRAHELIDKLSGVRVGDLFSASGAVRDSVQIRLHPVQH